MLKQFKNHLLFVLICALAGCLVYIFLLNLRNGELKEDNKDLKTIIHSKEKSEQRFEGKDGKEHVKKEVDVLHDKDNIKIDPELVNILKSFDVRLKNIEVINSSSSVNEINIIPVFKDSTINDTLQVKCLSYSDKWIDLKGCEGGNMNIIIPDTTSEVIYKERKKFPVIKIGNKYLKGPKIGKQLIYSEIVHANPNIKTTHNRTVVIKK